MEQTEMSQKKLKFENVFKRLFSLSKLIGFQMRSPNRLKLSYHLCGYNVHLSLSTMVLKITLKMR